MKLLSVNPWTNMITIHSSNSVDPNDSSKLKVKKLLCSINFTEQLNDYKITKLIIIDEKQNCFEIDEKSYEKKENEIMIRNGPIWTSNHKMQIQVTLEKLTANSSDSSDSTNELKLTSELVEVENIF